MGPLVLYGAKTPSIYNVTHVSYNRLHSVVKPWDHHFIYTPVALWECVGGLKTVMSNDSEIAIETLATLSWFTEPLRCVFACVWCSCCWMTMVEAYSQRALFDFKICDVMNCVGKTWFCFDFILYLILFRYLLIFWCFNIFILIILLILMNYK